MKKVYVDAYLNKNLGDDLFLHILFNRYQNVQFYIEDTLNYSQIFCEYKNIHFIRKPLTDKVFRFIDKMFSLIGLDRGFMKSIQYNTFDAYVQIGGSIFIEHRRHFKINKYKILHFNDAKKNVFILGCNFEKKYRKKFFESYYNLFTSIDGDLFDICFRDSYSYNLFRNLQSARKAADIVFLLNEKIKKKEKEQRIGFSIINLKNRKDLRSYEKTYIENMRLLIRKSLKENYQVILYSFCESEGDLDGIREIVDSIPLKEQCMVSIYNYSGDIKGALESIASIKYMVATRFHAAILSQKFNQGLLPFIYSDKILHVLSDMNMDDLYIDIRTSTLIDVDAVWERMKNNMNIDTEYQATAKNHFNKLDKLLLD